MFQEYLPLNSKGYFYLLTQLSTELLVCFQTKLTERFCVWLYLYVVFQSSNVLLCLMRRYKQYILHLKKSVQYSMQKLSSFLKCNTSITAYIHYIQGVKKLKSVKSGAWYREKTHTHRRCCGYSNESPNPSTWQKCPSYFEYSTGLSNRSRHYF